MFRSFRDRWKAPQGYAEILRVGLPLVASMASSTVMQFTDRLFLSRFSVDAIAAALPASMASLTLLLTLMGVCGYTSVLIAQYTGSRAPHRVGSALWQGIWSALAGSLILCATWGMAEPLFALAGHAPHVQELEVDYFRVITAGSGFALFGSVLSGFYSGRGQTRPVMVANMAAAVINVPLDYVLIFGGFGFPSLGITGAGIATVIGWLFSTIILSCLIFTRKHDLMFHVRSSWRFEWDMFRRLLRYGLPSSANFFVDIVGITWFSFEVGSFGTIALAASNIAFSINSLIFLPTLGLNIAVSSLVGQAMGRGSPQEAETVTWNALHLALVYMLSLCAIIALSAGPLMDFFAPGDMTPEQFAPVRALGITLLYFVTIYSLIDAGSIIYFGALKGAGDTLGVMMILVGCMASFLVLPILYMKYRGTPSVHGYWIALTVYIIMLAASATLRFYRRRWHTIRVVETAPPSGQG